jgi:hypothetical protein
LGVSSSFDIPAASCRADGPAAGVPLIGAVFDELKEPVFAADDPFDELDWDELADAPQAVNASARMVRTVNTIIDLLQKSG